MILEDAGERERLMEGVDRVLERLLAVLRSKGLEYHVLGYPEEGKRSIDVLIAGEGRRILVKVVDDLSSLRRDEVRELRGVSGVMNASPLLVASSERGEELEDIVAYEKMGVYAVSPEGFQRALDGSIYVVQKKGRFYMRLDGEVFRREREARGLSLGETANMLGVTRRAIYEYERGGIDVELERALRIMEVFGEDVFKPVNVLRVEKASVNLAGAEEGERRLGERIIQAGGVVFHARRTAVDLAARVKRSVSLIIYEHRREKREGLIKRGEEAAAVAEHTSVKVVAVIKRSETRTDLEAMGIEVVGIDEAGSILERLEEES